MAGSWRVALLVGSLAIAGVIQGWKLSNPTVPFADATNATLVAFRFSTTGLALLFIGSLMFFANVFSMTFKWKWGLMKSCIAIVKGPSEVKEVRS